jgi:LysM repeat protein
MTRCFLLLFLLFACRFQENTVSTEYTVQRGDSLAKIAKSHNISVADLRSWNDVEGNLIHPGQVLHIREGENRVVRAQKPRKRRSRPVPDNTPPSLAYPPLQACLKGPDLNDLEADEGFLSSQGLNLNQLRKAMNAFIPNTLACAPQGTIASGTLRVEMTVACTGRVSTVRVMESGPFEEAFVSCVTDTLKFTAFPAHDMPDGVVFDYPLRFEDSEQ